MSVGAAGTGQGAREVVTSGTITAKFSKVHQPEPGADAIHSVVIAVK